MLPRAEQVRRPLQRCLARGKVRVRSPISRFHARTLYSYQYHFHAVLRKRYTTVFYAITRKVSSFNCFHAVHMKNVPRRFLSYHTQSLFNARFHAITREVSYDKSPDNSSSTIHNGKLGRRQSSSSSNNDGKTS